MMLERMKRDIMFIWFWFEVEMFKVNIKKVKIREIDPLSVVRVQLNLRVPKNMFVLCEIDKFSGCSAAEWVGWKSSALFYFYITGACEKECKAV